MSTDDRTTTPPTGSVSPKHSGWAIPAFLLVIGAGVVVALLTQGRTTEGLGVGGIILVYGLFLVVVSRRSETVALLRGEADDERQASIALRANAATGVVVTFVLVGGFIVSLVTDGPDTGLWSGLCAVAGVTFVAATAWLSARG